MEAAKDTVLLLASITEIVLFICLIVAVVLVIRILHIVKKVSERFQRTSDTLERDFIEFRQFFKKEMVSIWDRIKDVLNLVGSLFQMFSKRRSRSVRGKK